LVISHYVIGHWAGLVISHWIICIFDQPVNRSQRYPQLPADFALAEAGGGEFGYLVGKLLSAGGAAAEQVRVFGAEAFKLKVQKGAGLLDAAQAYIIGAVALAGVALFDLFEVAQAAICVTLRPSKCAFADGEGAVGKVDEQFAAVQVVGADGLGRVAPFGGMRQYQDGQVVVGFERFEAFHERKGHCGIFGAAAQAGNVIDDEHGGLNALDLMFDGGDEQLVFVGMGRRIGEEIVLCAEKVRRKGVILVAMAVAQAELALVQLEVEVEHAGGRRLAGKGADALPARNAVADLHGEHRFAGIGIGKHDAEFVLVPEFAQQHFGFRFAPEQFHPAAAAFDSKLAVDVVGAGPQGFMPLFSFSGAVGQPADFGAQLFDVWRAFGSGGEGCGWWGD